MVGLNVLGSDYSDRLFLASREPKDYCVPTNRIDDPLGPTQIDGPERNSLVLIRKGGENPPLFLVHDGLGETMPYLSLARRLEKDQAVYGLQPCVRRNAPIVHTRTAEMAAYHIDKIRSVQPHGPYLLGGFCVGGVIAFEIARQLQRKGEKVAMVALLEVAAPSKNWPLVRQRIRRFSTVFHKNQSGRSGRSVRAAVTKSLWTAKNLSWNPIRHRLRELRDDIRMRLLRYHLDRSLRLPRLLEGIPVQTVCLFADKEYRSEERFDGELILFRATSGEAYDEPFAARYDDPLLGWAGCSTRGVRVHDVPGGHFSMLQEPNVRVLAEQLQRYLDRALARQPAPSPNLMAPWHPSRVA
jgi:thioesterase domain-containing protein